MGKFPVTLFAAVASIALLAPGAFGAEAVKLRHLQSLYSDGKEIGFKSPEGVGCDDKGRLLVADSGNGRIVRFSVRDGIASPEGEIKVPELSYPIRVRVNSQGEIFALDGRRQRVVRLNAQGEFLGRVDAAGSPSPATIVPRSFAIGKDDSIYLLDVFAGRVLVLAPDGKFAKSVDFPAGYENISDLAIDGKGTVYLVDSVKAIVYAAAKGSDRFAPLTESLRATMKFPATIATDTRGEIFLADRNGNVIFIVGQDGSLRGEQLGMGWTEGLLYYPEQICINDKDEVFIADRGNSRVQLFLIKR